MTSNIKNVIQFVESNREKIQSKINEEYFRLYGFYPTTFRYSIEIYFSEGSNFFQNKIFFCVGILNNATQEIKAEELFLLDYFDREFILETYDFDLTSNLIEKIRQKYELGE